MTRYRRIVRRRFEAAFKVRMRPGARHPVVVMDHPGDGVPPEIIDLATGPFEHRFPDLAAKRAMGKASR